MTELRNVSVRFGDREVLRRCSLSLPAGSRTALLGPSGCGKTTLLRVLAGLQRPDAGEVQVEGKIAFVFQEPRLLPWRTALQNVNAVLSDRPETLPAARALLQRAGLGDALDLYPRALSGGMRQRVSLCRALAFRADLLLLDEPLKGLDPALHADMAAMLRAAGGTQLLVTHSEEEAALLTDRILRFRDGAFPAQP